MFHKSTTSCIASRLVLALCFTWFAPSSEAQTKKPFTVSDDIGMSNFHGFQYGKTKAVQFSPDGKYFAVYSDRGRLDLNRVEDSLRFYRSEDVEKFLKDPTDALPRPIWIANIFSDTAPVISDWRWLSDSSGAACLEGTAGRRRLVLANLRTRKIEALTSPAETVKDFDIHDRLHYVYIAVDSATQPKVSESGHSVVTVGTGRSIFSLLSLPDPNTPIRSVPGNRAWAVFGGKRFELRTGGAPLVPAAPVVLSPDGKSLVTELEVPEVPVSWESLYPPSFVSSPFRIRAGHNSAHQFVSVSLQTGAMRSLTDAPVSNDAGWWTSGNPTWSNDSQSILLPGTFLHSEDQLASRPCVAVVDMPFNTATCVEMLKARTETGIEDDYHSVSDVRFIDGDKNRVMVAFHDHIGYWLENSEYRRTTDGHWELVGRSKGKGEVGKHGLEIEVAEAFDRPPTLIAREKEASRLIWDPNPEFKNLDLGESSVYTWKDEEGQTRRGGLYKPSNYRLGERYPLVIQTHNFIESVFLPSGGAPTAFAARELAASGIVVLQVPDEEQCETVSPHEGPCAVSSYEAAANKLVSEGLVDPEKIGIIGWSRTCFYVMEALTMGSLHFKAASITDGVMVDYWQYIANPERVANEFNSMIGAPPFGDGLQLWLKRSPGFNLDKVNAPLLINTGEGVWGVLNSWQPYAALSYLRKPVDLIRFNTDEHIFTNPAVRMASQGGTVDWFCFWLKDTQDPDSGKSIQYERWRELRKLQIQNEKVN